MRAQIVNVFHQNALLEINPEQLDPTERVYLDEVGFMNPANLIGPEDIEAFNRELRAQGQPEIETFETEFCWETFQK